ncbi:uncharacterized protein LOC121400598 [Xenopus laevis]|uniref:Uncharacterized protein LOC121400598 n=1 Tax=Xenopus laevis TaxID=8355 RepID=A0A8J1MDY6_XENLA|nr:uncharacterized protein LOC121400598 [Xenopus laevis]
METAVLAKGLTFVPSTRTHDFNMAVDNYKFTRSLRLREHYGCSLKGQAQDTTPPGYKLRNNFDPITHNTSLKTFSRMVNGAIRDTPAQIHNRGNLNKKEREALEQLKNNPSIIIKPADKGGAVVILDYAYYKSEICSQLADGSCYQKLTFDPTLKFQGQLGKMLDEAVTQGWITEDLRNFLYVKDPNWPIVATDPDLGKLVSDGFSFGYKRSRNLKELLTQTDPINKYICHSKVLAGRSGVYRCGNCSMCSTLITGNQFFHPHTGKSYKIKDRLTCTSKNVIYIIKCPCGLVYCGKTCRQLKERISMHRSSIRAALDPKPKGDSKKQDISKQPVAQHWLNAKHSIAAFKCMPIDSIPTPPRGGDVDRLLLQREAFWTYELDSVAPRGLNTYLQFNSFLPLR